jgi:hypothetical protein
MCNPPKLFTYILEIINKLNFEFPKIHVLLGRKRSLYTLILKSFLKKQHVSFDNLNDVIVGNSHNYLPLEQIYCEAKVEALLKRGNVLESEVKNFKIRVLDFYVELAKQIKQRFNFNDPILTLASNFDPKIVISRTKNSINEVCNANTPSRPGVVP